MTEGRLRGPLSFKRWSVESLPDDDVSLDVVDGKMNALTGHKAEVAEQSVGEAQRPEVGRSVMERLREYAWGYFMRLNFPEQYKQ